MLQNYNFFIFSPKFSFDRIESFRFRFCAEKLNFAAVDQFFFDLVSDKKSTKFFTDYWSSFSDSEVTSHALKQMVMSSNPISCRSNLSSLSNQGPYFTTMKWIVDE